MDSAIVSCFLFSELCCLVTGWR
uniref:Uncharacterized protein n=1 Tax=Rhizophora mucronata TaxID=61149 RepID=A0A2P2N888_RHIMU